MYCRYCKKEVLDPSKGFCSSFCHFEHQIRFNWNFARKQVFKRDKGVCFDCNVDTKDFIEMLIKSIKNKKEIPKHRKTFWDMHHSKQVADGGCNLGLNNLYLLCIFCHQVITRDQTDNKMMDRYDWKYGEYVENIDK